MTAFFQNTYDQNMPKGRLGRFADCGFKNNLSPFALEIIDIGLGVLKPFDVDYKIMLPRNDLATNVFSGDLVASNEINVTVNGVAITPVVYAVSHLATMQAIADEIELIPTVASATVGGANDRTITIISVVGNATVISGFLVTLGASQATVTTTLGQNGLFFGVTLSNYAQYGGSNYPTGPNLTSSDGDELPYQIGEVVPTLTRGRIYIKPEVVMTSNSAVYLRVAVNGAGTAIGQFLDNADGGNAILIPATTAIIREGNATVGDLAVLEINLP